MALSTSDKSGSNVTNLDDARKLRANSPSTPNRDDTISADSGDDPTSSQPVKNTASRSDKPSDANQKVSNRRFDKVKVERIKAEIARGDYEIDFLHVADKFIEHERYA